MQWKAPKQLSFLQSSTRATTFSLLEALVDSESAVICVFLQQETSEWVETHTFRSNTSALFRLVTQTNTFLCSQTRASSSLSLNRGVTPNYIHLTVSKVHSIKEKTVFSINKTKRFNIHPPSSQRASKLFDPQRFSSLGIVCMHEFPASDIKKSSESFWLFYVCSTLQRTLKGLCFSWSHSYTDFYRTGTKTCCRDTCGNPLRRFRGAWSTLTGSQRAFNKTMTSSYTVHQKCLIWICSFKDYRCFKTKCN